ncbi:MAG TPA: T9SS type A sorting domain-containing protein, partial [Bacteroidetes bacterium]|nr:T9SS type A sorting domain-containing protein [Bacteroidota bacterium]
SQRPDGGWDYTDDPTLKNMPGTTLGTCARKAYAILRTARISGNTYLKQRGLKALEFMNRFRVPRGAQTWEVPLHAPDVLAAANAVIAYLEGFQLTGRQEYLDRAKYWAETSLPFLYLWRAEGRSVMPYGSIPVFGATWYTGTWFGNVVQWNGLELAYSLSKLAIVTGDTTWQHVAQGLVRFGMQLQDYTAAHYPENAGMYPDAFDMTTGEELYHWDLSPELVQRNLLRFQGLDPDISTAIVAAEAGTLYVSAGWPLTAAKMDSSLTISLRPAVADSGWLSVAGVTRPRQVLLGGQALPEVADPDSAHQGWHYSPTGVLFVKIFAQPPEVTVKVTPARGLPVRTEPQWDFNEPDYLEGWLPNMYVDDVRVADGVLSCVSTWIDPYLEGPFGQWSADSFDSLVVVMAVDKGNTGQLFWSRTDEPYFTEPKSVHFALQTDGRFHRIAVPLRGHAEWRGTILRLRLDPTDAEGAHIRIDEIRLTGRATAVQERGAAPRAFALSRAFPNPFNPDTQFVCELPRPARLRVSVYDVLGREVARLAEKQFPAGRHRFRWDGRAEDGRQLPSGVYVVRVRAQASDGKTWQQQRKVVLLR